MYCGSHLPSSISSLSTSTTNSCPYLSCHNQIKKYQSLLWKTVNYCKSNPICQHFTNHYLNFQYSRQPAYGDSTFNSKTSAIEMGQDLLRARMPRRGRQLKSTSSRPKEHTAPMRHNHTFQHTHLYPWTSWDTNHITIDYKLISYRIARNVFVFSQHSTICEMALSSLGLGSFMQGSVSGGEASSSPEPQLPKRQDP